MVDKREENYQEESWVRLVHEHKLAEISVKSIAYRPENVAYEQVEFDICSKKRK